MNLHWLLPARKGIPVLMYHRIWPGLRDRVTQTPEQLREQWLWLKQEGYRALGLEEYLAIAGGQQPNEGKNVLITFDDGYYNNLQYAYPLLRELGFKATFFLIGETLEGKLEASDPLQRKMSAAELRSLSPDTVQFGMHGFRHENFKTTPLPELRNAIERTMDIFRKHQLPLFKVLAYPYGGRPKDASALRELKDLLRQFEVTAAFRIGNKVSEMPAPDPYEIKRIDIRGTDSFDDFRIKLLKGRLRPF